MTSTTAPAATADELAAARIVVDGRNYEIGNGSNGLLHVTDPDWSDDIVYAFLPVNNQNHLAEARRRGLFETRHRAVAVAIRDHVRRLGSAP